MADELSDEQRESLQEQVVMIKELGAVPDVAKHDSQFSHEVALRAKSSAMDAVRRIVEKHLGEAVDPEKGDPLVTACGGIRGGQTLFTKSMGGDLRLYVAFWPWAGGKTITIKIGVHG